MTGSATAYNWQFSDDRRLPVGTLYCIGRNYARHAREMGASVPERPVVFLKPPAAYLPSGSHLRMPTFARTMHHELELVVVIGRAGADLKEEDVAAHIAGYAVGLDMTLRDLQQQAKERGEPWATAKGFAGSAPVSSVLPASRFATNAVPTFDLRLYVNGELRQQGNTASMERSVEQLVAHLSSVFTLRPGDGIFTGTPEGVGPVRPGDRLHAQLGDFTDLALQID